ncbi:MAG: hypothetical protein AAGF94_20120 [Pseudomonadota bacterium]
MDARSGKPFIQADLMGLPGINRTRRMLAPLDAAVWAREPLLDETVKNGRVFF